MNIKLLIKQYSSKWQQIADLLVHFTQSEFVEISQVDEVNSLLLVVNSDQMDGKITNVGTKRCLDYQAKIFATRQAIREYTTFESPKSQIEYSTCLGYPIAPESVSFFGTICLFRHKAAPYTEKQEALLQQFRNVIEHDIEQWFVKNAAIETVENRYLNKLSDFKAIFNQDKTVKLLIDAETREIVDANTAAMDFYGYKQMRGLKVSAINVLSDADIKRKMANVAEYKANYFEFKHRLKNGEIRDVEVYSTPILLGEKRLLFSIIHDITQRKQIEAKLIESEEKYRKIVETTVAGFWIINKSGKILEVNESYCKMSGYSRDELINKPVSEIDFLEQEKDTQDRIKRIEKEGYISFETVHLKKNGKQFQVHINVSYYSRQGGQFLCFISDISLQKRNEQALKISEAKYRELFEANSDGIAIFKIMGNGQTSNFIDLNHSAAAMLGYSKDEVMQKAPTDIEVHIEPENLRNRIKELSQQRSTAFETQFICKNGQFIDVEVKALLIEYNREIMVLNISRDISKRKKYERQLYENERKLKRLNDTKDKLFSIIAHDLRSPFSAIIGFSEMMYENVQQNKLQKVREHSRIIHRTAKDTYNLLNNLLQWSRVQSGRIDFVPKLLALNQLVDQAMTILHASSSTKNINMIVDIDANMQIYADAFMLDTILRNLISNAIKFSHPGTEVLIKARKIEKETIISIIDTGIGIPEEYLNDLFDISKQTTQAGTNHEQGSGLGLILCYEFAQKHGGNILVKSQQNLGSTFVVSLPDKNL